MAIQEITTSLEKSNNDLLTKISETLTAREEKDNSGGLQKLEKEKEEKSRGKKMLDALLAIGKPSSPAAEKKKAGFFSKVFAIFAGVLAVFKGGGFGKLKTLFNGSKMGLFFTNLRAMFGPGGRFAKIGKVLGLVAKSSKVLLRVLGWPINILFALIGAVKGFMFGYKKNGSILEGLEYGLVGMVDGLVGWAFEALAWVSGWVLEKLGFDKKITDRFKTFDFFTWAVEIYDIAKLFVDDLLAWFQGEEFTIEKFLASPLGVKLKAQVEPFMDFLNETVEVLSRAFDHVEDWLKATVRGWVVKIPTRLLKEGIVGDELLRWVGLKTKAQMDEESANAVERKRAQDGTKDEVFAKSAAKQIEALKLSVNRAIVAGKGIKEAQEALAKFKKVKNAFDMRQAKRRAAEAAEAEKLSNAADASDALMRSINRARLEPAPKDSSAAPQLINVAPTVYNSSQSNSQVNIAGRSGVNGSVNTIEQFMRRWDHQYA